MEYNSELKHLYFTPNLIYISNSKYVSENIIFHLKFEDGNPTGMKKKLLLCTEKNW